jgi:hypothetical protein
MDATTHPANSTPPPFDEGVEPRSGPWTAVDTDQAGCAQCGRLWLSAEDIVSCLLEEHDTRGA